MIWNKKGQIFNNIGDLVKGLVVVAIVLAIGFLVIAETQDQIVTVESVNETGGKSDQGTTAYNSTQTIQSALEDVPAWLPIIVIVVIGGILISLIAIFRRGR